MSATVDHDVYQAIADPTRREILNQLSHKELYIGEITDSFSISRPAIAKHLRILHHANLVDWRKHGRKKYYSLNPEPLKEVQDWVSYFEKFWKQKLQNLKNLAETTSQHKTN